MRAGAKVGRLGPALSSDVWHSSVLRMNAVRSFPFNALDISSLLTPVILTELGAPGIQKKKRFRIEDEDESD